MNLVGFYGFVRVLSILLTVVRFYGTESRFKYGCMTYAERRRMVFSSLA